MIQGCKDIFFCVQYRLCALKVVATVTRANWCTRSKCNVKKKKTSLSTVWSTESVAETEIGPVDSTYQENWETKRKESAVVNICHM